HRPQGGELHRLHALRAELPRLVHLHRGPQGDRSAPTSRRQAPLGQQARPLRHRLLAVHVLRDLRRGLPVRRPVLEPRVRVLRAAHRRPAARQGAPRRVDGDGPRLRAVRGGLGAEGPEGSALMVAQNVFFYLIAAVMVVAALAVVTTRNVVRAALYLVVVFAGVSAIYILLAAEFVAVTQILVYIGAIMVLMLFGIMLTRAKIGREMGLTSDRWWEGLITA